MKNEDVEAKRKRKVTEKADEIALKHPEWPRSVCVAEARKALQRREEAALVTEKTVEETATKRKMILSNTKFVTNVTPSRLDFEIPLPLDCDSFDRLVEELYEKAWTMPRPFRLVKLNKSKLRLGYTAVAFMYKYLPHFDPNYEIDVSLKPTGAYLVN